MGTDGAVEALIPMLSDYMDEVAVSCHERLGEVAGVAVTLSVGGEPFTVGSSTALALDVDLIQYAVGTGPCLTALREGIGTYVADLAQDLRWGDYGARAAERGASSCVSVPVLVRGQPAAVLKVYFAVVDGLSETQRRIAGGCAGEVSGGIGLARSLTEHARELDDRVAAMDSRRTIDIAIGILMERTGCGPAGAFNLLRRYSQVSNTKLREAARALVSAGSEEPEVTQAPFSPHGAAPRR